MGSDYGVTEEKKFEVSAVLIRADYERAFRMNMASLTQTQNIHASVSAHSHAHCALVPYITSDALFHHSSDLFVGTLGQDNFFYASEACSK